MNCILLVLVRLYHCYVVSHLVRNYRLVLELFQWEVLLVSSSFVLWRLVRWEDLPLKTSISSWVFSLFRRYLALVLRVECAAILNLLLLWSEVGSIHSAVSLPRWLSLSATLHDSFPCLRIVFKYLVILDNFAFSCLVWISVLSTTSMNLCRWSFRLI